MRTAWSSLTRVGAAVTAAAAALTVWTWSSPVDRVVNSPDGGHLTMTYSNPAAVDAVHGADGIVFGDPVFRSLADSVNVTATWDGAASPETRLTLSTMVSSSAGWSRRFGDTRSMEIADGEQSISLPLDLAAAWRLAGELDDLTHTSGAVQVGALAELHDSDEVLGHAVLAFDLTATTAQPASPAVWGGPGSADGDDSIDLVALDTVDRLTRESRHLALGPLAIARSTARPGLAAATTVAAVGTAVIGGLSRQRRRRSPALDAWARHGRSMVRAVAVAGSTSCTIDLADIDELARVARDLALPIVVMPLGDMVVHQVIDGNAVYRFSALLHSATTDASAT